jgi:hypothetical protein
MPKVKTKVNVGSLVDQLGKLKAEMADLKEKEETIRQVIVESGKETVEGKLFRCTVVTSEVMRIDYKGICEALPPPTWVVKKHTTKENRTTVRVVARNGK